MSGNHFQEVRIFNDDVEDVDIIKRIIMEQHQEEAFYTLNIGDIIKAHMIWLRYLPRVTPYYAVKCNADQTVIKILATMNARFDCASKQEIMQVMKHGVAGERIIFANPMKIPSHIVYAKNVGVSVMTADSEMELKKIKSHFPCAKIMLRIRCDAAVSVAYLGLKYGCDPDIATVQLIHIIKELGLTLFGFSFHVGSPCGEVKAISRGIRICRQLIDIAKLLGCGNVKTIDIGGGIPGERDFLMNEFADVINEALRGIDPTIEVISEPGRYYVTSAFTLATCIHGKKTVIDRQRVKKLYYTNDGIYGSFLEVAFNFPPRIPSMLKIIRNLTGSSRKTYLSTVWGPTCDSFDWILKDIYLPEYDVGDWLLWKDMGAYTLSLASAGFNGFKAPQVYPVIRRKEWYILQIHMDK